MDSWMISNVYRACFGSSSGTYIARPTSTATGSAKSDGPETGVVITQGLCVRVGLNLR